VNVFEISNLKDVPKQELTGINRHINISRSVPQPDVQVMLDKDLAIFYGVKTIRLREQVKRNIKRFPSDFMFQLTEEEVDYMVSQNAIPSKQHLGGSLPLVFSKQGVATISAVLTSERAIEINIQIMRALVAMRRFIASNAKVFQRLDNIEQKQLGELLKWGPFMQRLHWQCTFCTTVTHY